MYISPTYLIMIHEVPPGDDLCHERTVPTVSRRDALHVRRQAAVAVERFAFLDLVDHLAHIHVDFARIFGPTV